MASGQGGKAEDEARLPFMPLCVSDFLGSCSVWEMPGLSQACYLKLLAHEWNYQGRGLPADRETLEQLLGVDEAEYDRYVVPALRGFTEVGGRLHNARTQKELRAARERKCALSLAGKKGGVTRGLRLDQGLNQEQTRLKPGSSQDQARIKHPSPSPSPSSDVSSLPSVFDASTICVHLEGGVGGSSNFLQEPEKQEGPTAGPPVLVDVTVDHTHDDALRAEEPKPKKPARAKAPDGEPWDYHLDYWNALADDYALTPIKSLSETRRRKLTARLLEHPDLWDVLDDAFKVRGQWATEHAFPRFDQILEPRLLDKILEGNYAKGSSNGRMDR